MDGSIKQDLPVSRLSRLYGVNHTIVSQTNPHVVPFISRSNRGGKSDLIKEWVSKSGRMHLGYAMDLLRKTVQPAHNEAGLLISSETKSFNTFS